jgi:hypothetical protein
MTGSAISSRATLPCQRAAYRTLSGRSLASDNAESADKLIADVIVLILPRTVAGEEKPVSAQQSRCVKD